VVPVVSAGLLTDGLASFDQRIKDQLATLAGGKVVGRSFRDVADHSGTQLNAAPIDPQPAAALENVADDVPVVVIDLLAVGVSMETKDDETAGKSLLLKAALMTDLVIEFGEMLERVLKIDNFHIEAVIRREAAVTG
jgi:hypothetical protein